MKSSAIGRIQATFATRLETVAHLLNRAEDAFGADASCFERRIAPDMHPFGTQIAFTCNQPRNFALWCAGKPADNLEPIVTSFERARGYITQTTALVLAAHCDDAKLDEMTRVDLGPNAYAELSGAAYVNEFLLPNFYFHLVTAYDILRMAGVNLGKADYMRHLLPFVKQHG